MNLPPAQSIEQIPTTDRFAMPGPNNSGVLVTGGAKRIGGAITLHLASAGWPVAIHYNASEEAALALRDKIRELGGKAECVQGDLSQPETAAAVLEEANGHIGPIGVLINNASVFEWDDLHGVDDDSWSRHMDLNLRAPLFLCRQFVDRLPNALGGVIINMIDARVLNPKPRHMTYTLSKSGLWTLTRMLAHELAPRIRVNGIGPGPTLPEKGQTQEDFEARCALLPLKRPGTPADIARTVDFLISVQSITGQIIAVDGGDHLAGFQPS